MDIDNLINYVSYILVTTTYVAYIKPDPRFWVWLVGLKIRKFLMIVITHAGQYNNNVAAAVLR